MTDDKSIVLDEGSDNKQFRIDRSIRRYLCQGKAFTLFLDIFYYRQLEV